MATSTKRTTAKKTGENKARFNYKWVAFGCAVFAVIGIVIWLVIALPKQLYYQNPRLKFRNLEIDSTGYWQKQHKLLMDRAGISYGMNIFTIDPAKLKEKLEKIPSIESAEVSIVLPDTLKVKLNERIPRASLYSANSSYVVDKDGILIKRSESSAGPQRLPVIKHLRSEKQIAPALQLIMSALSNYPQIAIQEISLAIPGELNVILYYREHKRCRVKFPAGPENDYNYLLSVLQTTILRSDWGEYDLRYNGSVTGK